MKKNCAFKIENNIQILMNEKKFENLCMRAICARRKKFEFWLMA